jgi:hypothetical protein
MTKLPDRIEIRRCGNDGFVVMDVAFLEAQPRAFYAALPTVSALVAWLGEHLQAEAPEPARPRFTPNETSRPVLQLLTKLRPGSTPEGGSL